MTARGKCGGLAMRCSIVSYGGRPICLGTPFRCGLVGMRQSAGSRTRCWGSSSTLDLNLGAMHRHHAELLGSLTVGGCRY